MANTELVTKRMAISKSNAQMVIVMGVSAFVTVFCLVAAHAVWQNNSYQAKVTSLQQKAHLQLQQNITAYGSLTSSYQSFVSTPNNVIGGLTGGSGQNDGDNAKIILDALPPSYDFPALTSSIEKILTDRGFNISDITGSDEELAQENNNSSSSPTPVSMPFTFTVQKTNYTAVSQLMTALQASIRPIQIDSIDVSGGNGTMTLTVDAHTFYQPSKNVNIITKVVP